MDTRGIVAIAIEIIKLHIFPAMNYDLSLCTLTFKPPHLIVCDHQQSGLPQRADDNWLTLPQRAEDGGAELFGIRLHHLRDLLAHCRHEAKCSCPYLERGVK